MAEGGIRVRACLAALRQTPGTAPGCRHILLVAHYGTDAGPVQWLVPGGGVELGESLEAAALREFAEETGLRGECQDVLDVSEVILLEKPWHSISVVFRGCVTGGALLPETHPTYGAREARWFAAADLAGLAYHPRRAVEKALGLA